MTSKLPVQLRPIPLWDKTPDGSKWNKEALLKRYLSGRRSFERGFRQKAFVEGESTFPSFAKCEVPGISLGEIARSPNWPKVTGVDLSSKKRPGNAIITVAVNPANRRRFPVDIRFGAWRSSETAKQIQIVNQLYNPIAIMVEDNSYQEALIDWVTDSKDRYSFWMKVEPTTTTGETKADPEKGLPALEVEFSNGGWCFPLSEYEGASTEDEDPKRAAWARLSQEFSFHPIAATSDGVMAAWFARQGIELFTGLSLNNELTGDLTSR